MKFHRISPGEGPARAIECYWTVVDTVGAVEQQKIIPDGFTEIIFHFGDPYRIKLSSAWATQPRDLIAGQISKHFFLENTGRSDILGIKMRPAALTHLFGLEMDKLKDKVAHLDKVKSAVPLRQLSKALRASSREDRMGILEEFFAANENLIPNDHPSDRAIESIRGTHGLISVGNVALELGVSERYLEKIFRKYVGLSPKFYARIVRFNYIFQLIKDNDPNWADVVFESGYYDQSHFIRNFKAFTGEDPSRYMFREKSLANFFLKKG